MGRDEDGRRDNDQVRAALRDAILRGTFAPRQRLVEGDLSVQFAASRFLIRNALLQLAAEGLVEIQPNRGARVREISLDEALEITEIRRAVEGLVTSRAASRITTNEVAELRTVGESMKHAVAHHELARYSELNAILHQRLRDIGAHLTSNRILGQLNAQMVRHQFTLSLVPGRANVSLPQHLAVIDAVCRRDPDAAEQTMREHIGSVLEALRGFDRDLGPGPVLALSPTSGGA